MVCVCVAQTNSNLRLRIKVSSKVEKHNNSCRLLNLKLSTSLGAPTRDVLETITEVYSILTEKHRAAPSARSPRLGFQALRRLPIVFIHANATMCVSICVIVSLQSLGTN